MSERPTRAASLAGIAFGVLAPISVVLQLNVPTQKGPIEAWTEHLGTASDRSTMMLGAFLMAAAVVALGWWLTGLSAHLASSSAPHHRGGALMSGSIVGCLLLVAATTMFAVYGTIEVGGAAVPDGELGLHIWYLGFWILLLPVSVVGAFFVVTTIRAGSEVLPGWVRVAGWVAVPVMLTASFMVVTLAVLPIWVALAAVSMLTTRAPAPSPRPAPERVEALA